MTLPAPRRIAQALVALGLGLHLAGCSGNGAFAPTPSTPTVPGTDVTRNRIAAGDMSTTEAVLWTRALGSESLPCAAEVATDAEFRHLVRSVRGSTVPANSNTWKVPVRGLQPATRYYYRFTDGARASLVGQFRTLPEPATRAPFKVGFSGDADARFRPYPALADFGTDLNAGSKDLDAWIFLGDVIYERNDTDGLPGFGKGGAVIPTGRRGADVALAALDVLNLRYLANLVGVNADGTPRMPGPREPQGLQSMFAAAGSYLVLDNHEIFGPLQSGGAPLDAIKDNFDDQFAVNRTGEYNNKSVGFLAEIKAFYNNLPTAVDVQGALQAKAPDFGLAPVHVLDPGSAVVSNPADPRSHGTPVNYFTRSWGRNAFYIQLDDRTYRDARMVAPAYNPLTPACFPNQAAVFDAEGDLDPSQWLSPTNSDPAPGVYQEVNSDPRRTALGATQLQWFLGQLLQARDSGVKWIVVGISTPIDQRGSLQDSKSWFGGYPAERNTILKFLADQGIRNVVFLTTDDHGMRVTPLQYQPDPLHQPSLWAPVPRAFQVLAGPMGAGGPDDFATPESHSFQSLLEATAARNQDLGDYQQPLLGLVGDPGLANVWRDGDPDAARVPRSVDFYAPDQFGYTTLEWDADGNLTVEFWGLDSYQPNTFPDGVPERPSRILSFTLRP